MCGDATDDAVMTAAGIDRAATLVTAVDSDAANLFITLSARARRPELFIVSRVRDEANEAKLRQAGADRVVNPQQIGGGRIAALALAPNVADFLDVVMHDGSLEFRLADVAVPARPRRCRARPSGMPTFGTAPARWCWPSGHGDGRFATNPAPETVLTGGDVLIAIGTEEQLSSRTCGR